MSSTRAHCPTTVARLSYRADCTRRIRESSLELIGIKWKRTEYEFTFEFTPPILDFLAQQILLVQEQNHRDRLEPAIVPNRVEQFKRLAQPILGVVLAKRHIVRACCHHY